jgi:hypothetical protein
MGNEFAPRKKISRIKDPFSLRSINLYSVNQLDNQFKVCQTFLQGLMGTPIYPKKFCFGVGKERYIFDKLPMNPLISELNLGYSVGKK